MAKLRIDVGLGLALAIWLNAASCSSGGNGSETGVKGTSSSSGGKGTTSSSGGGATSSSGNASSSGAGDDGGDLGAGCNNTDLSIISIDPTGWVPSNCDSYAIQGAWYCYDDGTISNDTCVNGSTPYASSSPGPGMCIGGGVVATTAYGPALGFSLNDSGGTSSVKGAYNATAHGIDGFDVTIAGNTGGLGVRVGFTQAAASNDPAPFFQVPGAGTYTVLFSQANVPASWKVANAGATVDPTMIYDVQFELATPSPATAVTYDWCVTSLKPHVSADAGVSSSGGGCSSLAAWGNPICANPSNGPGQAPTDMPGYGVQNDLYNTAASGSQCLSPEQSGNCAAFTVTPTNLNVSGGTPASYPSLIYGWQYGNYYGSYTSTTSPQPKQLSAITSAPTTWSFTPGSGKWDASYDIWLNATGGNPSTPQGGLELMIWANYSGAVPFGSQQATANIGGINWAVWEGQQQNWTYVAYVAPQNSTNNAVNLDLKAFFNDVVSRQYGSISNSWYLLGVQNGFELWNATSPFTTNSFTVSVN
jgi:hypothetical protein